MVSFIVQRSPSLPPAPGPDNRDGRAIPLRDAFLGQPSCRSLVGHPQAGEPARRASGPRRGKKSCRCLDAVSMCVESFPRCGRDPLAR